MCDRNYGLQMRGSAFTLVFKRLSIRVIKILLCVCVYSSPVCLVSLSSLFLTIHVHLHVWICECDVFTYAG